MTEDIISKVEIETLFQHVINLEGIKHPIIDFTSLERARKYIINEFTKYGYTVQLKEFTLDGFDQPFYNIEAFLDPNADKYFLVTSHYDTVMTTPGANDNTSAVAVSLEIARVIKDEKFANKVKFVCFTLEENDPSNQLKLINLAKQLNLVDEKYKPTTHSFMENRKLFEEKLLKNRALGSQSIFDDTLKEMLHRITEREKEYFTEAYSFFQKVTTDYFRFALIGSSRYVQRIDKDKIIGILNYDCVGYTDRTPNSQSHAANFEVSQFPKHNTSEDLSVGDFVLIMSDGNSQSFGSMFFEATKNEDINLASCWIPVPLQFEQIAQAMPDILRSDHAPFWKENIPGVFVSDTANFRNPNYHRPGDTFDTLDYEFMVKVAQATIEFLSSVLD